MKSAKCRHRRKKTTKIYILEHLIEDHSFIINLEKSKPLVEACVQTLNTNLLSAEAITLPAAMATLTVCLTSKTKM